MVYDRNTRGTQPGDYYNRQGEDYGRDYGSGRDYTSSSARDYAAAGEFDRDDRGSQRGGYDRDQYGARDYGRDQNGRHQSGHDQGGRYGQQDYGNAGPVQNFRGRGSYGAQGGQQYGPSRGQDDRGYGSQRHGGQGYGSQSGRGEQGQGGYGRQPQGYDYDDRGFFDRAGDEVRSWFGDEEAERRRDMDARYDQHEFGDRHQQHRDSDYHSWRQGQISQLDRDYDEYRRENRSKFENEFTSWRTGRQGQRELLNKVDEHMDVVGADGAHVGTVDKVRGDRILLTKNDQEAGGHHHSIPSSWLKEVGTSVTLSKTADEAKKHWRDEERNQAMLADDRGAGDTGRDAQGRMLGRSFTGTY